jgi:4'-phosphopantetheinyl transferase
MRHHATAPAKRPEDFVPATIRRPLGDDIHVWFLAPVDGTEPSTRGAAGAARAQRFLRRMLEAYLDRPLRDDDLERGEHGKPSLRLGELSFNLTHAGDAAAVAIARDVAVGIDMEDSRRPRPALAIAQRYFCESEAAALAALAPDRLQRSFVALWTAKEAVLKALGRGLAFGLDRLEFSLEGDEAAPCRLLRIGDDPAPDDWQLVRFSANRTLGGTLAWRGTPRRVLTFRADDDDMPAAHPG